MLYSIRDLWGLFKGSERSDEETEHSSRQIRSNSLDWAVNRSTIVACFIYATLRLADQSDFRIREKPDRRHRAHRASIAAIAIWPHRMSAEGRGMMLKRRLA